VSESDHSFSGELRKTIVLAAPIAAGHLGQMILGLADTVMIGRVGVVPLAAVSFSNAILHFVFLVGIGLLTSISILVSNAWGKNEGPRAANVLKQGSYLAGLSGVLLFLAILLALPLIPFLGQPPAVVAEARPYLWIVGSSMPWAFLMVGLKNYSEAQSRAMPAFWCGLGSVLLNVFLNWLLIYGNWGFPRLELVGAGIATWISRLAAMVALFYWLRSSPHFRPSWPQRFRGQIDWELWKRMGALGFPVAFQLLIEVGTFSAAALLCGLIGTVPLAAHQIAITCAAMTFMFPLGISLAVTIRVGQAIGSGHPGQARVIGKGALLAGACLSGCFACVFILFNQTLARAFTPDETTVLLASSLIVVAGFFQFFDSTQVIAMGGLRGCQDVKVPTWIMFFAFWLVALPVGSVLAFPLEYGAVGIWIGLAFGLSGASLGLMTRFFRDTTRRKPRPG